MIEMEVTWAVFFGLVMYGLAVGSLVLIIGAAVGQSKDRWRRRNENSRY